MRFWRYVVIRTLLLWLCTGLAIVNAQNAWDRPGCHRLGHTRTVTIPGCVAFRVTTNACRGYCESYAVPSSGKTISMNPRHVVTSHAECCSISETHTVKVRVRCLNGFQEFSFGSAKTCSCSVCRKT